MNKNKFTVNMTEVQKKHIKSIEWLFDDTNIAQGRSILLAYVYIKLALKGKKIKIIDHHYICSNGGIHANLRLASIIEIIIKEAKLNLQVDRKELTIYKKND